MELCKFSIRPHTYSTVFLLCAKNVHKVVLKILEFIMQLFYINGLTLHDFELTTPPPHDADVVTASCSVIVVSTVPKLMYISSGAVVMTMRSVRPSAIPAVTILYIGENLRPS